jgi:guanylate kinase
MKGKMIIISAPSGTGKTSIIKPLLGSGLPLSFSISATNRPPRPNEQHGRDYYFFSDTEFHQKLAENAYLEWEEVYPGRFYGTLYTELDRIWNTGNHVLFDLDVMGGLNVKRLFPDQALSIFIMPPSLQDLEKRLVSRGTETPETLIQRIEKAEFEMTFAPRFDAVIVNDKLEIAQKEVLEIVTHFIFSAK